MDQFLSQLQALHPLAICAVIFFVAFLENIIPPVPSDMIIVFGGSLVGLGIVGFPESLLFATAGSTVGFVVMYKLGQWFGVHIIESGKLKFIPIQAVRKVEAWFVKYGYWVIVANRFLAGTRAAVGFFAGMSELNFRKTTVLSLVSALVWNSVLITSGYYLGQNWDIILVYMGSYGKVMTIIVIGLALIGVAVYFLRRKKGSGAP